MSKLSFGYTLSSEEHRPLDLIKYAVQAEQLGFDFLSISDHYFPWLDQQGQSPFVWSMLGALSQATQAIPIMTGVTCPLIRIHPAIIAQAAATAACLLDNRFWFGIGTGENLNEHVVGLGWPNINHRQAMLEEAVSLIKQLWTGQLTDHQGPYFTLDQAKIYTLPQHLPPIYIAAGGTQAATMAGQIGDGLISTSLDSKIVKTFDQAASGSKPKLAQMSVCIHPDEQQAKRIALQAWPNAGITGQASQELPMPAHFEQLAASVTEDQIADSIVCGMDVQLHLEKIQAYIDAGFTHIYFHQVGPDQQAFFDFYPQQVLSKFKGGSHG